MASDARGAGLESHLTALRVHGTAGVASPNLTIATAALATVSCVFPGLAAGALTVQAAADFGVTEGRYGLALSAFFLGAASGSVPAGLLAQRLGPRRQLSFAILLVAAVQASVTILPSFGWMLIVLAMAGVLNSVVQTAVNLMLSQARLPRLGLAIATKQSAMPASAMLGGLAVPALALTLGWRWAYGMGAVVALAAFVMVQVAVPHRPGEVPVRGERVVDSTRTALLGVTIGSVLLAFTAGAVNAYSVSSGVDAGISEGLAGLLVSAAALTGIVVRVVSGGRVDRGGAMLPLQRAALFMIGGVTGFLLLSLRIPVVHGVATLFAFGLGWIWPVFTNFAVVNANPRGAGAATGFTQMGTYIGVFFGPLVTGMIIDRWGYSPMWIVVGAVGILGGVMCWIVAPQFSGTSGVPQTSEVS